MKWLLTLCIFCGIAVQAVSQTALQRPVPTFKDDVPFLQMIREIEQRDSVKFYFLPEWVSGVIVPQNAGDQTIGELIDALFKDSDFRVSMPDPYMIVLYRDPSADQIRKEQLSVAERDKLHVDQMVVGQAGNYRPGKLLTLTGIVRKAEDQLPLNGAEITTGRKEQGTSTDQTGHFKIALTSGSHVVTIKYVGFQDRVIDLRLNESGEVMIDLSEEPTLLNEVVVSGQSVQSLQDARTGQLQLGTAAMKKQPLFLGETDIVRQIQTLPGVTTAGEAASGFNVRGGSVDQNLVLYDGMPIFNTAHALGFFSAFNAESIQDLSFYRGSIPSEFGGRVSSVLDIRSKAGQMKDWQTTGGLGLISANIQVRGPIQKDKTSVALSLRSTHTDWLMNAIRSSYVDLSSSSVGFLDGNLRIDHILSAKTRTSLSIYYSRDQLRIRGDSSFSWSNFAASWRIDHQLSQRLNATVLLGVGSYQYGVNDRRPERAFDLTYQITYPVLKADLAWQAGQHRVTFGLQSQYYKFNPGKLAPADPSSSIVPVTMTDQHVLESGLYVGDQWNIHPKWTAETGLRISHFALFGPATIYNYLENAPRTSTNLVDSTRYASGDMVQQNIGLEPRLSLRYALSNSSSIKAGYHHIYQYLHLVTNTTAVTPVDIWQPSNPYFKPQSADQISLGYYKSFKDQQYDAYVEGFYKLINNILDFRGGSSLILNKHLETELMQGKGESYGVETYLSRNKGRLTWTMNYTWSRALRTIPGVGGAEGINGGRTFAANYDQPHNLNLSWNYRISKRISFTGNFAYRTGRPVTIPQFAFDIENYKAAFFSERNQYRIPDYHRLDLALSIEGSHRLKKFWRGTWVFSVLNVYGRRNPYAVFFDTDANGALSAYRISIIGSVLPSVTYQFRF